jgi:hypothetical protein
LLTRSAGCSYPCLQSETLRRRIHSTSTIYNGPMKRLTVSAVAATLLFGPIAALAQSQPPDRGRGALSGLPSDGYRPDLSPDERQRLRRELQEAQAQRRLLRQPGTADNTMPGMSRARAVEPASVGIPSRGPAAADWRGPSPGMHPHRGAALSDTERQQLREQLRGYHGRSPVGGAGGPPGSQP